MCLRALQGLQVERIYYLGDAVGYFSDEVGVLELLRSHSIVCQKGNHEAMLLGEIPLPPKKDRIYRIEAARARLSTKDYEFLASWPEQRIIDTEGKRLLLVHGSPDNRLEGYVYPSNGLSRFDELPYDAIMMGHTHHPFVSSRNGMMLVNVGSCGLPRDQGDLLAFAVYDSSTSCCEVFRMRMDIGRIVDHFALDPAADEVYQCLARVKLGPVFGRCLA
jgi:predicted phosphodiesterase